jgi:hypothetical protein
VLTRNFYAIINTLKPIWSSDMDDTDQRASERDHALMMSHVLMHSKCTLPEGSGEATIWEAVRSRMINELTDIVKTDNALLSVEYEAEPSNVVEFPVPPRVAKPKRRRSKKKTKPFDIDVFDEAIANEQFDKMMWDCDPTNIVRFPTPKPIPKMVVNTQSDQSDAPKGVMISVPGTGAAAMFYSKNVFALLDQRVVNTKGFKMKRVADAISANRDEIGKEQPLIEE